MVVLAGLGCALVLGSLAGAPRMAGAQGAPNPSLTLTFGASLDVNDNRELATTSRGTTTSLDNRIGLSYLTETAVSSLRFDAGTVLRFADTPTRRQAGFQDHRLALGYTRTGASSSLSFNATARRSPVEFFDPFGLIEDPEVPIDTGDLTPGVTGDRTDRSIGLQFATGTGGPIGLTFAASHRMRDFSDTTDPSYFATTTDSASLGLRLRVNEVTDVSLNVSHVDFSAEDIEQTRRRTQGLRLGVTYALAPDMSLGLTLGKTDVDVVETIGGLRSRRQNDGLTTNLSFSRDLVNGDIGLTYARDVSINGTRNSLTLRRSLELTDGALSFSLGTTRLAGGSSSWTGNVAYRKDLPAGSLTATLDRRVGTSEVDDEVTTTRARLGWSQALTPVTGLSVSLDYLDVDSSAVGGDRSRARLQLAHTWDLAQDWQLSGGYTRTESRRETGGRASSNAIFLSLQRSITFAP